MQLLIVEPSEKIRLTIRATLQRHAPFVTTIHECSDGPAALDHHARNRPDWVLLDLKLDQTGGLETARRMLQQNPHARIIALCDYDGPEYHDAAADSGLHTCLLKENLWRIPQMIQSIDQTAPADSHHTTTWERRLKEPT